MEACCRKIHVLNGAANDRHNVPVEKRHFLISIPKQFGQRLGLQRGMKITFMIDKTREGIAYVFTPKALQSLDSFCKTNLRNFWNAQPEPVDRNLQCKTIDPQQFSFYIAYDCMKKLNWPSNKGTRLHMIIMDEMILRLSLMKGTDSFEH